MCKNHSSPKPDFCDDLEPTASPTMITCLEEEIDVKLDVSTGSTDFQTLWAIGIGASLEEVDMEEEPVQSGFDLPSNSVYNYHFCLPCDQYVFVFLTNEFDDGNYTLHIDDVELSSGSATTPFEGGFGDEDDTFNSFFIALVPFTSDEVCPTRAPTESPTPAPPCPTGEITFKLDLYTDDYGSETGWNITDISTNALVTEYGAGRGDEMLYFESNTYYRFRECLPCGGYNFTIFDTFGDGFTSGGGYTVTVDDKVIKTSNSTSFTEETVTFGGGSQCPPPPFMIMPKGKTNMCIQPQKNRLDSPIFIRKCRGKNKLQRWTVDWMGQIRNVKARNRCIKVKDGELIFHKCSKQGLRSDLSTNFIVGAVHERISWMNDARKVFSLLQGNSKRVKLADFWNPEEESEEKMKRQAWSIKYDY